MKQIMLIFLLLSINIAAEETSLEKKGGLGSDPKEGLTDQDYYTRDNYIHEGYSERKKQEECSKKGNKDACSGTNSSVATFAQIGAKMYATVVGAMDGTTTMADDSKMNDYCKYICVASETLATFKQTTEQTNLLGNMDVQNAEGKVKETEQRKAILKGAQSYETRADTAKIQAYGFGATGVCYAGMLTYGFVSGGYASAGGPVEIGIKAAAATGLTILFAVLADEYQSNAQTLRAIAAKLPSAGDCNPITDTECYCAQPETKYDQKYCAAKPRTISGEVGIVSSCLNAQLKPDTDCSCEKSNTCFDKEYSTKLETAMFGADTVRDPVKAIKNLSKGNLRPSEYGDINKKKKLMADKMKELGDKLGAPPVLTSSEKGEANAIMGLGIPANIAAHLAAHKLTSGQKQMASRFQNQLNQLKAAANNPYVKNNVLTFTKGSNPQIGGNDNNNAAIGGGASKSKKGTDGNFDKKVLTYAEQAAAEAQVHQDPNRSIFEILSRRYQIAGPRELEIKNEP